MMTEAGGIMQRLRDETSAQHSFAESQPLEQALIAGTLPRAKYIALLGQRFLIHRALESAIAELARTNPSTADLVPDELLQAENLRRDLAYFGVDADGVPALPATQDFVAALAEAERINPLALLGCYYVFEGSKNGARFIVRRLRPVYGLSPGPGTLYLDPHGERQRPLWAAFKERMDAVGFNAADQDAMVAAAKQTFEAIGQIDNAVYGLDLA